MLGDRSTGDLGSALRAALEKKRINLRRIADSTKISTRLLEALDRNDISLLPGGIFSRSFVRAYATEVGLDPEQAVREFIAQFPDDSVTAGHPTTKEAFDSEDIENGRRTRGISV